MGPAEDSAGVPGYWLDEDHQKAVQGGKNAYAAGLDLLEYARSPTAEPQGFVSCLRRALHAAQAARDSGKSVWDDFVRAHRTSGRKLPDIEGCVGACCALDLATRFAYAVLDGTLIREPDEVGGRLVINPQQPEVSQALIQVREMPLPPLSLKHFYGLLDAEAGKAGMLRKGLLAESPTPPPAAATRWSEGTGGGESGCNRSTTARGENMLDTRFCKTALLALRDRAENAAIDFPPLWHMLVLPEGESLWVPARPGGHVLGSFPSEPTGPECTFGTSRLIGPLPPAAFWPQDLEPLCAVVAEQDFLPFRPLAQKPYRIHLFFGQGEGQTEFESLTADIVNLSADINRALALTLGGVFYHANDILHSEEAAILDSWLCTIHWWAWKTTDSPLHTRPKIVFGRTGIESHRMDEAVGQKLSYSLVTSDVFTATARTIDLFFRFFDDRPNLVYAVDYPEPETTSEKEGRDDGLPLESGTHVPTTTLERPGDPAKKAAAAEFLRLAAGEWHLQFTRNGEPSGEERCRIDAAGGYYLLDRRPGQLWCNIEDVQYDAVTRNATFSKVKMRGKRWRHEETVVFLPDGNRIEGHDDSGKSLVYDRLGADAVRCSGDPVSTREKVFISYSHKDKKFLEELLTHLNPLERAGRVTHWSDKQIQPGSKWFDEIKGALACSKVAILLVTKDFLASDFIHEHELTPLLKEAEHGGVTILWVLVRACSYKETPLQHYQAVIPPDKPLAEMKAERDRAWVRICAEIKKAANA